MRENRDPLVCVQVLSPQQRLSVALCVAQWLTNMCPSRRITRASGSLQTNTPTHIFGQQEHLSFPLHSPLSPTHPVPFHFDGWWFVQSCGPTVLSWCEPNPSGTQYPVYQLSALWKPQQYWAEAEVQNSLQFVQVTTKVKVFCYSAMMSSESILSYCCVFLFFQSIHVFMSCSVSKPPSNHIWSCYGGPHDNWFDTACLKRY